MSLNADLREFIELLNSRGIEYVIVGAHSLAFHARPRYTGDLDILVRPSPENAAKLVSLLRDFGFAKGDLAESDFTVPEQMIQLGRAPNRIDLLTSISGVTVAEAFSTRMSTELEGLPVFVLSKEALIRNKRAVGRPQDIADRRLGRKLTAGKRTRLVSRGSRCARPLPSRRCQPCRSPHLAPFARSFGVAGSH